MAIAAAGAIWWSGIGRRSNNATTSAGASRGPDAMSAAAASAPGIEYLAGFHSMRDGQNIWLRQGARVVPGDRLFLEFRIVSNRFSSMSSTRTSKARAISCFRFPGTVPPIPSRPGSRIGCRAGEAVTDLYWQVSSVGGREHFYVFASVERPVAFEQLLAALPVPEIGKPVVSLPLPKNALGVLRGVGGLAGGDPAQATTGFQPRFPRCLHWPTDEKPSAACGNARLRSRIL